MYLKNSNNCIWSKNFRKIYIFQSYIICSAKKLEKEIGFVRVSYSKDSFSYDSLQCICYGILWLNRHHKRARKFEDRRSLLCTLFPGWATFVIQWVEKCNLVQTGVSELSGQGGHVPTYFFAWPLLKRDICQPTFYYQ